MQYTMTLNLFGRVMSGMVRTGVPDKAERKAIRGEYRAIMERASDIGSGNTLLFSYTLAAFFIAMNRVRKATAEENIAIMEEGMRTSKMVKALMGSGKSYFSEKRMETRRQWSKETHEKKYKNDWVVDVLESDGGYRFGLDYTECGVCKLCRDEGCPELAKYLCSLDFMLVDLMGIELHRTMTLAEGAPKCDFRFYE